jgi:hypothetical protein
MRLRNTASVNISQNQSAFRENFVIVKISMIFYENNSKFCDISICEILNSPHLIDKAVNVWRDLGKLRRVVELDGVAHPRDQVDLLIAVIVIRIVIVVVVVFFIFSFFLAVVLLLLVIGHLVS